MSPFVCHVDVNVDLHPQRLPGVEASANGDCLQLSCRPT
jgi:hypothetical protein